MAVKNHPNWANSYSLARTKDDLAELPNEAVIRDAAGDVWEAWGRVPDHTRDWHTIGDEGGYPASRIKLPALVLFAPEPFDGRPVNHRCCGACWGRAFRNAKESSGSMVEALQAVPSIMIICPLCGDKRCPRAAHHDQTCKRGLRP